MTVDGPGNEAPKDVTEGRLSTETVEQRRARLMPDPEKYAPSRAARLVRLSLIPTVSVLVLYGIIAVFNTTGLPAPGPLRRYPIHELEDLASRIHSVDGGDISPWCSVGTVRVDALRSRVIVTADPKFPHWLRQFSEEERQMLLVEVADDRRCGDIS